MARKGTHLREEKMNGKKRKGERAKRFKVLHSHHVNSETRKKGKGSLLPVVFFCWIYTLEGKTSCCRGQKRERNFILGARYLLGWNTITYFALFFSSLSPSILLSSEPENGLGKSSLSHEKMRLYDKEREREKNGVKSRETNILVFPPSSVAQASERERFNWDRNQFFSPP